jgi:hypothetical protein
MHKVCKSCTIPIVVSRDNVWLPNGTIVAEKVPTFKIMILEVDYFKRLYSDLEGLFGKAIPNCITQGTRKNAKIYINGLLKGPLGYVARSRFGSRKVYDALVDSCLALGYGRSHVVEYERGTSLQVDIVDTIYPPHFLGDLRGAFESVEKKPSKGRWKSGSGGVVHLTVEVSEDEDPLEDRFDYQEARQHQVGEPYPTCPSCGLPTELGRFEWDLDRFWIHDSLFDQRVLILGFNDMIAIMHELEKLVGDLLREKVKDLTVPFGRAIGERLGEKAIDGFAEDLRIKGWGYPTLERTGTHVKWRISNPSYTPFIEGRLVGIYEAVNGRTPEVRTEKSDGILTIEMK